MIQVSEPLFTSILKSWLEREATVNSYRKLTVNGQSRVGILTACAISTKYLTISLTVNFSLCSRVSFPSIHESIRGIEIVEAVEVVKASELVASPLLHVWPFCSSADSTSVLSRSFLNVTGLTSRLERLWEADILLATCCYYVFRDILVPKV